MKLLPCRHYARPPTLCPSVQSAAHPPELSIVKTLDKAEAPPGCPEETPPMVAGQRAAAGGERRQAAAAVVVKAVTAGRLAMG